MTNINIFNQIICGDIELVRSAIATKYQAVRKDEIEKLKIDILTTSTLTDPIILLLTMRLLMDGNV